MYVYFENNKLLDIGISVYFLQVNRFELWSLATFVYSSLNFNNKLVEKMITLIITLRVCQNSKSLIQFRENKNTNGLNLPKYCCVIYFSLTLSSFKNKEIIKNTRNSSF